jgi:hypothetical protein
MVGAPPAGGVQVIRIDGIGRIIGANAGPGPGCGFARAWRAEGLCYVVIANTRPWPWTHFA